MTNSNVTAAPPGLKKRGRRLWKQVLAAYELRLDERILLESACKTVDLLDDLEAAMASQPLITKGSMGQERENPLLSEARQQRAQLNRTLAQLKLPDEKGAAVNQQRAAGHARWAVAHG